MINIPKTALIEDTILRFIPWLLNHGVKAVVILITAKAAIRISDAFISRLIRKIIVADDFQSEDAERKREDTLIRIFTTTIWIVVWVVAILMILAELGFAVSPFIAAAGITGLALGFGGQYLIRDLISGLFIVMENQYRIGDVVSLDGTSGLVEDISLRMTTLRDLDGVVHHVPHGEIKRVSNLSKNFARVNLNIGIAYNSNIEMVIGVINEVGNELATDPLWSEHIIKPPQFLRVEDFADSAIILKILGETKPSKKSEITGELRRRLKIAFDRHRIEIPFPQRVVHHLQDDK